MFKSIELAALQHTELSVPGSIQERLNYLFLFFVLFCFVFCFVFFREYTSKGERERERESKGETQAGSMLNTEANMGLHPMTLGS